ncbi:MAG: hypothetical protein IT174_14570 [Acidobacteria bacterium]|nr:hypothetical protein [Acidobacteriota bacterium]
MNIFTSVTIVPLLLSVVFGASCQSQRAVTQNESGRKARPPDVSPTAFNPRDSRNELINEAGWVLPQLSSFQEKSRGEYKAKAIAKIEQTYYVPLSDVIQTADGNTFNEVGMDPDIETKSWLIRYLKVFSADGQPFCYVMRGNLVDVDASGEIKGRQAMSIILVYSDRDGDGRFESFEYSGSEAPLIPGRLTER